jgi:hypothetical protein
MMMRMMMMKMMMMMTMADVGQKDAAAGGGEPGHQLWHHQPSCPQPVRLWSLRTGLPPGIQELMEVKIRFFQELIYIKV